MPDSVKAFASKYRVRVRKDDSGDVEVIGKRGTIYDYRDGQHFAAQVTGAPNAAHWNRVQRTATGGHWLKVIQNGDEEGTFLFDPADETQVNFAFAAIRPYRKRTLSPEARLKATERLQEMRKLWLKTKSAGMV